MVGNCLPSGSQPRTVGIVSCPDGRVAVRGGVEDVESTGLRVVTNAQSRTQAGDWEIRVYNTRTRNVTVTIYADCALATNRGGGGGAPFRIDREVRVLGCSDNSCGRSGSGRPYVVSCPERHLARDGGASEENRTNDLRVESSGRDPNDIGSWVVRVQNTSSDARTMKVWALCIPPASQHETN
jgi:hypothetical protein